MRLRPSSGTLFFAVPVPGMYFVKLLTAVQEQHQETRDGM